MGYKFKEENGKFVWGNENTAVVLSSPSFQAFDDYGFVKSYHGILHYYYNVNILQRVKKMESGDDYIWKSVVGTRAYDFPNIVNLLKILETSLFKRLKDDDYQRIEFKNKSGFLLNYSMNTGNLTFSDFYQLDKERIVSGGKVITTYNFYAGFPVEFEGCRTVQGVRIASLKTKEVKALYKCVKAFIDYSINEHNKEIINRNKEAIDANKIVGDKFYIIDKDGNVDKAYKVGDVVDIDILDGSLDKDFKGICLQECTITGISGDILQVKSCLEDENSKTDIHINKILYISRKVPD